MSAQQFDGVFFKTAHKRLHFFDAETSRYLPVRDLRPKVLAKTKSASLKRLPPRQLRGPVALGSVGCGVIYQTGQLPFTDYSAAYYDIVLAKQLRGDSTNYLYLTSTNRTQAGVEALAVYYAQSAPSFAIYDWSLSTPKWVVTITSAQLDPYQHPVTVGAKALEGISVANVTRRVSATANRWSNDVLLRRRDAAGYDWIYSRGYTITVMGENWWGPIAETFQPYAQHIDPVGFGGFMLVQQGAIRRLTPANSAVRNDGVGLAMIDFHPNDSFIVDAATGFLIGEFDAQFQFVIQTPAGPFPEIARATLKISTQSPTGNLTGTLSGIGDWDGDLTGSVQPDGGVSFTLQGPKTVGGFGATFDQDTQQFNAGTFQFISPSAGGTTLGTWKGSRSPNLAIKDGALRRDGAERRGAWRRAGSRHHPKAGGAAALEVPRARSSSRKT